MADGIDITPGGGARVATDDVGGQHFQRVKLDLGADGASSPVAGHVPVRVVDGPVAVAVGETLDVAVVSQPAAPLYIQRIDGSSVAGVTFIGKAAPGSATTSPVWQVQKIDETGAEVVVTFASGGAFSHVWNNRTSLSYS